MKTNTIVSMFIVCSVHCSLRTPAALDPTFDVVHCAPQSIRNETKPELKGNFYDPPDQIWSIIILRFYDAKAFFTFDAILSSAIQDVDCFPPTISIGTFIKCDFYWQLTSVWESKMICAAQKSCSSECVSKAADRSADAIIICAPSMRSHRQHSFRL